MSLTSTFSHQTVLRDELVDAIKPRAGEVFVDCTLGGGGHAEALLRAADCSVIGIDRDPAALTAASDRLVAFGDRFQTHRGSFSNIAEILNVQGIARVDGVVADLGFSSPQIDRADRGFSFRFSGPLDMRMDPSAPLDAATVVNMWPEAQLADIIRDYGEERRFRSVAQALVAGRPWHDTLQLAEAVSKVVGTREQHRIHPATRTFQALRIAVNDELGELRRLLPAAMTSVRAGGRIAIISFHSLEDRIVKQFFAHAAAKDAERDPYGNPVRAAKLTLYPSVTADAAQNPRARSARLRAALRLP